MSAALYALALDALDPAGLAAFWSGLLGRDVVPDSGGGVLLAPDGDPGFAIRFLPTQQPKVGQGRIHFDLTSAYAAQQQETVDRALALGGSHFDIGQSADEGHVVLADPEGNELCVIPAGNRFLADTGVIGAVNCDGTRQVGLFWSQALGWPLVWDQDEETAIQSPAGGSKVTWSGPPLLERHGRDRMRFELAVTGDREEEVERLVGLGARRLEDGREGQGVAFADPDGNEFTVLPAR